MVGFMLCKAVIITGNGPCPYVGLGADTGIAKVSQMIDFDTLIQGHIFQFNEIANPDMACQSGTRTQTGIGTHHAVGPNGRTLEMTKGLDGHSVFDLDPQIEYAMRFDQNITAKYGVMAQRYAGGINYCHA